jgi:AcrR family transcriptional regulator
MGLRERKKEQTRNRIADVALRLFSERGFAEVTVNEIAEAAEVSKATLFSYFSSKESLVLQGIGDDDLARIVASRAPGQTPTQALRAYYREIAAQPVPNMDGVTARMRVIIENPSVASAANDLLRQQRLALTDVLAKENGAVVGALMAGLITAAIQILQESYFRRLAEGQAGILAQDVDTAFDLLENGFSKGL